MKKVKIFFKKRIQPSHAESEKLHRSTLSCCDKLIVNYLKQLNAITELQKIYDSDIKIPLEYQMDKKFFVDLAKITNEVVEDLRFHKDKLSDEFYK